MQVVRFVWIYRTEKFWLSLVAPHCHIKKSFFPALKQFKKIFFGLMGVKRPPCSCNFPFKTSFLVCNAVFCSIFGSSRPKWSLFQGCCGLGRTASCPPRPGRLLSGAGRGPPPPPPPLPGQDVSRAYCISVAFWCWRCKFLGGRRSVLRCLCSTGLCQRPRRPAESGEKTIYLSVLFLYQQPKHLC